jgi:RNA polymerase sigma factor (sigma-70 family)
MNDWRLLDDYVGNRCESAFSKLVERHMNLVYLTCRREINNDQLAEDATQQVFILLARKAPQLRKSVTISGWLYKAAVWVSRDLLKHEVKRMACESENMTMDIENQDRYQTDWDKADQWLSEGLNGLSSLDREIILMRYFDNMTMDEIAMALGTSAINIRKRLSRATDRLRGILVQQKVSITSLALTGLLIEHQARSAPETCSAATLKAVNSVVNSHDSIAPALHVKSILWRKGLYYIMETTKRKLIIGGALSLLLIGGIGIPVTKLCMAKAYDSKVRTIIGPGGVIGNESANMAQTPDSPNSADRQAIDQTYAQIAADFNEDNLDQITSMMSPDMVFVGPNGMGSLPAKVFLDNHKLFLTSHPETRLYFDIQSMTHSGDEMIVRSQIKSMSKGGPDVHAPVGSIRNESDQTEDHWQMLGGHWVMTKSIALSENVRLLPVD